MKIWNKIPSIIRGIIIGILIQVIGIMPLSLLTQKNIEILPSFPWALLIGTVFLLIVWKFLTGKNLFFSPSSKRIDLSRTKKMESKAIKMMLISGFFLSITLFAFVFIGYMIADVPLQRVEFLSTLKEIPLWTSLSLLFLVAVSAGVVEELAWRGYAQRIIEKRHSPILSISIVALVFTIIHFLPLPVWPLFFLGSLGWGFLAYYSNSIIPGIIYHTLIDLATFIWAFYNLDILEKILTYNVFEDGMNSLFKILVVIAVITMIMTMFLLKKLKNIKAYNKK